MKKWMKMLCLLSITAIFAACGNKAADTKVIAGQNITGDMDINNLSGDDAEGIFEGGQVCVSEDGRVTIESGIYPDGGTAPDYWAKWTVINTKGEKHVLRLGPTSFVSDVHALQKTDGTVYYMVHCFGKASSVDGYEWLEAYKIAGDSIRAVNVADGSECVDEDGFSVNYSIPDWYFTTNGAGYDWLFEYDAKSRRLYVPITENRVILDRYQVWEFNGTRFVCLGESPHKNLHESLGAYNRLVCYFTTDDYIVRVDSLDSRELRYASWTKSKTMADMPDLVLFGGQRHEHTASPDEFKRCDDYRFVNGNYEYIVGYCETKFLNEGYGEHHDYLLVKKNGNVVVKQEKSKEEQ